MPLPIALLRGKSGAVGGVTSDYVLLLGCVYDGDKLCPTASGTSALRFFVYRFFLTASTIAAAKSSIPAAASIVFADGGSDGSTPA